jgi:hypothetical protein
MIQCRTKPLQSLAINPSLLIQGNAHSINKAASSLFILIKGSYAILSAKEDLRIYILPSSIRL